ncbi:TPA: Eukaryotic initiation factor 4A-III [Trebouxia sp. C0004]
MNTSKLDLSNVTLLAYDEADLMLQKHDVSLQTTSLMNSIKAASCSSGCPLQVLMSGPIFDDPVRAAAQRCLHGCQVIKTYPSLSPWPVDMNQYKAEAKRQGDKHRLVQTILQSCDHTHQYVIFVRANETVRQLQKLVTKLGMPCSIARSGMRDNHWDNQMSQFCKGQTHVLITTDIMARNSHLMQKVEITINYNPPVGKPGKNGMFTTYVHRVCSSSCGHAVFNLWAGQAEKRTITAMEEHFSLEFDTLNEHEELCVAVQQVDL